MVMSKMVGARVRRKEDPRLITGTSTYVDDVRLPGILHAAFVRSQYPHGKITSIDVSEALAAGQSTADARKGLRMSPRVAARFVDDVSRRDVEAYRRALEVIADLELETRGGGASQGALQEDTQAVRAVLAATA